MQNEVKLVLDKDASVESVIRQLVNYMQQRGIAFKSVNYSGAQTTAIMPSMTSVNWKKKEIVLFCHKDNEDRDRIMSIMGKTYEHNSESTRPYKFIFTEEEFPQVVTILLMNEKNR